MGCLETLKMSLRQLACFTVLVYGYVADAEFRLFRPARMNAKPHGNEYLDANQVRDGR